MVPTSSVHPCPTVSLVLAKGCVAAYQLALHASARTAVLGRGWSLEASAVSVNGKQNGFI